MVSFISSLVFFSSSLVFLIFSLISSSHSRNILFILKMLNPLFIFHWTQRISTHKTNNASSERSNRFRQHDPQRTDHFSMRHFQQVSSSRLSFNTMHIGDGKWLGDPLTPVVTRLSHIHHDRLGKGVPWHVQWSVQDLLSSLSGTSQLDSWLSDNWRSLQRVSNRPMPTIRRPGSEHHCGVYGHVRKWPPIKGLQPSAVVSLSCSMPTTLDQLCFHPVRWRWFKKTTPIHLKYWIFVSWIGKW